MTDSWRSPALAADGVIYTAPGAPRAERRFLAFVESKAFNVRREALRTPLDEPLPRDPAVADVTAIARLNTIDTADFRRIAVAYDPGEAPSPAARRRRRAAHRFLLEPLALPVADLYASAAHAGGRGLMNALLLADWFHVDAISRPPEAGQLPIWLTDPDAAAPVVERLILTGVREVSRDLRRLLRDVFSLAHVGDLGSDDGGGGTAGGPDGGPPDPGPEPVTPLTERAARVALAFAAEDAFWEVEADRTVDGWTYGLEDEAETALQILEGD